VTEPSLALQGAIVTALTADTALSTLIAGRVFDRVAPNAARPYVRYGGDQVVPDKAECLERSVEIYVTLDVFSDAVGKPEAKRIVGATVDALDGADLNLGPGLALCLIEHDGTRYLDDEDTLGTHAVLTFRALIDAA
jgi:hypothetical protein